MNSHLIKIILCLFGLFFTACSTKYENYNLDGYSESFYSFEKSVNFDEITEKLDQIIENNENRVPPGIYAQYGYIFSRKNESARAIEYFQKEMELYPESSVFMKRLIEQINKGNQ